MLFRDRKHSVDRVIINDFNRKSGADLGEVTMVYGPAADEYTRSHHALALVLGTDIFFRNGAYRPESEEGRKILAHELTHVAQNKKREEYRGASREELEREAEAAEKQVEDSGDPLITRRIGGREYKLRKSVWKVIDERTKEKLEEKIESLERVMSEEEYLKLLFLDICLIAICIKYRYVVKQGEITSVTRYLEVICMILMLTIGIFIYE